MTATTERAEGRRMGEERSTSRRRFLAGALGAGAAVASTVIPDRVRGARRTGSDSNAATTGSYSSTLYALELGTSELGLIKRFSGGDISAPVIVESTTPYRKKHLGAIKYEDILLDVGIDIGGAVYEWIDETLDNTPAGPRRSGEVQVADSELRIRSRRQFTNALLTEIGFPTFDARSKEVGQMTLRLAPQNTVGSTEIGKVATRRTKNWLRSAFRFQMFSGDIDARKVQRIEAFTIKQTAPGVVEFPNLVITVPESAAASWIQWHEDFVIQGLNGEAEEKDGRIVLLDPTLSYELAEVTLSHLGIYRLYPDPDQPVDGVRRVKIELYCERMQIHHRPPPLAP